MNDTQKSTKTKPKPKLPTSQAIKDNLADFDKYVDAIIAGDEKLPGAKQTVKELLDDVKDTLKKFHPDVIEQRNPGAKPVPYAAIKGMLKDKLKIPVSEQTLRKYCQDELGFPKKASTKKTPTDVRTNQHNARIN